MKYATNPMLDMLMSMNVKIFPYKVFKDIIVYIFFAVLILNCNTIWTSYENTQLIKILEAVMVIIMILYIIAYKTLSYIIVKKAFLCGIISSVYIFVHALMTDYEINSFVYFVIDVFCIYTIVLMEQRENGFDMLYKYENIILTIAVVSLFFWVFGSVLGIISPSGFVYSNWTGNDSLKIVPSYYNLYYETQTVSGIIRNTSIFTEAPMYNYQLCIALLIELFLKKRPSKINSVILIITVFSTLSTTGICLVIIAIVAKMIFDNNGVLRNLKICVLPFVLAIGIAIVWNQVGNKLGTWSGNVRIDDFLAGFKAWKTVILFGAGFGNYDYVKPFMSSFRYNNVGFSNSPMLILFEGGIFLMIPYIYFAIKWIMLCIRKRKIQWFLFFACFMFLFIITNTSFKFLSVFLFMMPLLEQNLSISVYLRKANSI